MHSMRSLSFVLLLVLRLSSMATADADDDQVSAEVNPLHYRCRVGGGRYAVDSTYLSNLKTLAKVLVAKASTSNFAADSAGAANDTVYGFVLCRGDYSGARCAESLRRAFENAVDRGFVCPSYKDVTIYYDQHMLRFSGDNILQNLTSNRPAWVAWNMNNETGAAGKSYGAKVRKLINATVDAAAANSSARYATGMAGFGEDRSMSNITVYGMVQCTPDLSASDCRSCLADLAWRMPAWFSNEAGDYRSGGRILGPRCNLRYEKDLFFQETNETLRVDMPEQPSTGVGKDNKPLAIAVSIAAVFLFIIVIFGSLLLRWIIKRKRVQKIELQTQNELEEWTMLLRQEIGSMFTLFTLAEIRNATDNFSEAKRLGEGAFGPVYQGQLTCGVTAIKRLASYSRQGLAEFRNEIGLIANLQHLNLVKLIGCCMQHNEKILVYEYMMNKSLDDVCSDVAKWASLVWPKRKNIIDGIAQGLLYIHSYSQSEKCIVHRDLKASNILLDSQMNPKISDFGIARMFSSSATESHTTRLMGTRGYMAPEYYFGNIFSVKSDVYSFGVLVLEMISGRKVATSFRRYKGSSNLMSYAWQLWEDGNCSQLIDNSLSIEENNQEADIVRCIQIALLCVQASPEDRPDMKEVVRMLCNKDTQLGIPKHPSYFNESITAIGVAAPRNQSSTEYQTAIHVHPAYITC